MTLDEFLQHTAKQKPLCGAEIGSFMDQMNNEARKITCELNQTYHTPD